MIFLLLRILTHVIFVSSINKQPTCRSAPLHSVHSFFIVALIEVFRLVTNITEDAFRMFTSNHRPASSATFGYTLTSANHSVGIFNDASNNSKFSKAPNTYEIPCYVFIFKTKSSSRWLPQLRRNIMPKTIKR